MCLMQESSFGKKVQHYREKQGLTQEQLAEKIEMSQNFISALERGKKLPSFDTLIRIIDELDVTADNLLEDIIKNGHKAKESRLSNRLDLLPAEKRKQILVVVEAMIDNFSNSI